MNWLFFLVFVIGIFTGAGLSANAMGWWSTYGKDEKPFNWRVFLGPGRYMAWLDRREGQ